jgi:hypothetical protein
MGYTQYTKCVEAKDHGGKTVYTLAIIGTIVVALIAGLINPYALVAALVTLIAYCHWWLYDRLICLGGEKCAIGLLGNVEPPEDKSFPGSLDTDYSINLILAPHDIQELPADYPGSVPPPGPTEDKSEYYEKQFKAAMHRKIADDGIQGDLIREQSTTSGEDFEGSFSTVGGDGVLHKFQPYLHAEFEGGGIQKLYDAAKTALAFATAAAVFCAIPLIGWAVCAVLSIISLIVIIAGFFNGLSDKAKPSVFDEKGNQVTTLENLRDILFVQGDWVFDTAHQGWNEIHPIKHCQLVAKAVRDADDHVLWDEAIASFMVMSGRWQFDTAKTPPLIKTSGEPTAQDWKDWVKSICDAVGHASTPLTIRNQADPANQWETHPDVDGCRPAMPPPPDIR